MEESVSKKTEIVNAHFTEYKTTLGFWVYLMTDCILFASLFATFAVLRGGTAGGPSGAELFEMPMVLAETLILLTSSFTAGMALLALRQKKLNWLIAWLLVTFAFGAAFLAIELYEFGALIGEGYSWQRSAFLSAFFVLVGAHGLHILFGLLWLAIMVVILIRRGITSKVTRQLKLFTLFWHFLDLVWIFIFTIVYLMGVAA